MFINHLGDSMKIKLITILFTTLLIVDCATAQEYTIEEIQLSGNVHVAYPISINNNLVVVRRCYIPSYSIILLFMKTNI